jgi:hypothetical protein
LIRGGKSIGEQGFGGEVREALRQRADFLIDKDLPNGADSASFSRATCWRRCAGANWRRQRSRSQPRLVWSIGRWPTGNA